jgi:hypothetical protein
LCRYVVSTGELSRELMGMRGLTPSQRLPTLTRETEFSFPKSLYETARFEIMYDSFRNSG